MSRRVDIPVPCTLALPRSPRRAGPRCLPCAFAVAAALSACASGPGGDLPTPDTGTGGIVSDATPIALDDAAADAAFLAADHGPATHDVPQVTDGASVADTPALDAAPPGDALLSDAATPPADGSGPSPDADPPLPDAAPPPDAGPPPPSCAPAEDPFPDLETQETDRFVRVPAFPSQHVAPRRVSIRLPPGGLRAGERLPVLYMHDGQNVFYDEEASFGVSWGALGTLDDLAAAGTRLLVVAVDNTDARIAEYTPVPDPEFGDGGAAPAYGRFLVEELKPWVDFHFPTLCTPAETGVLGSSLGGLVSLYLAAEYPEVFGRVGAFSPSIWWDDGHGFSYVAPLAALHDADRRLYVDGGNLEGEPASGPVPVGRSSVIEDDRLFMDQLAAAVPAETLGGLMLVEDPVALHDETAWRRRLPNALRFLFGPPLEAPEARTLWPWWPLLRRGGSTRVSIFATDAAGRFFSVLGPGAAIRPLDPEIATGEADIVTAVGPGTTMLSPAEAGAPTTALLTVGAQDEALLHLLATVPAGTDRVFASGDLAVLRNWDAAGLELRPAGPDLFEGFFPAPDTAVFQFKMTRGTWETVERGPGGEDIANRRFAPAGDGDLAVTVSRWADAR